jgi:peptidylprolyl isomerase
MANVFVCRIFHISTTHLPVYQFDFQVTREEEIAGVPTIISEPFGTMEFVLHDDIVPKTTRNFRELATGQHGYGYQGSKIFRIISFGVVQGGDITENDGNGGRSIFPRNKFEGKRIRCNQCLNSAHLCIDENFDIKHSKPGQLTMANSGVNSNTSQFFITLGPCPWFDGTHVAFGAQTRALTHSDGG